MLLINACRSPALIPQPTLASHVSPELLHLHSRADRPHKPLSMPAVRGYLAWPASFAYHVSAWLSGRKDVREI